jgi:large subunit ribosomal protein L15
MLNLKQIKGKKNATKSSKRVGRGSSSGLGKTCGRGSKGQKSRSGVSINAFEGGQMSIFRRVPKRGFNSKQKKDFAVVNIRRIAELFDSGKVSGFKFALSDMNKFSLAKDRQKVKLIGKCSFDKKVSIQTNYISDKLYSFAIANSVEIVIV